MNIAKRPIITLFILLVLTLGAQQAGGATTLSQPVLNVVDTNPDPNIFEAALSADEQDVTIDGTTVHALIFKDDNRVGGYPVVEPNGIPIPQIVVNVGDEVIVQLTNNIAPGCAALACDTNIHFHGVEADNDSDGTGVTQNHLTAGQTYTYRFIPPRPGIFWLHNHMVPGPQTFAGMYGVFIVKDPNEATLQGNGRIPSEANTHTVVLSDIEYDVDGDVGYLDAGQAIPWKTLMEDCATTGNNCQTVANGDTVLVNGQKPTASTPMITAKSGAGIRLRLLNTSTNRYFRLQVLNNGADNNLYRIGGEGGFLEKVRLEGGTLGTWDTKYAKGEIMLSTSARADVVVVPTGNNGDIITITSPGYSRGGPAGNNDAAGDLLYIVIDNNLSDIPFSIAEGNDVLGTGGVDDLKSVVISDFYINPPPVFDSNPGAGAGSSDHTIRLRAIASGQHSIDGVIGHFEDSGPNFTLVPYQNATRYARTGDTLEFTITNYNSNQHHPFHHHGFSFQPVRVIDHGDPDNPSDDTTLYTFDYNEFVDVIDVFNGQSVVVRMRLDDRPRITDNRQEAGAPAPNQHFGSGGAKGRWVFHCHLLLHAAIGMISELVVLDPDPEPDLPNNDVLLDFGRFGVFAKFNNAGSFVPYLDDNPEGMAIGDIDGNGIDDVLMDFGSEGIKAKFNDAGSFVPYSASNPNGIAIGNIDGNAMDDVLVDFGIFGVFARFNNASSFVPYLDDNPEGIAIGDIDGNGIGDVLMDFGSEGIKVRFNNAGSFVPYSASNPNGIAIGNIDGNAMDDVLVDFGRFGTFARFNNASSFVPYQGSNPDGIAIGDMDGNGIGDVLMDFARFGTFVKFNNAGSFVPYQASNPNGMAIGNIDGL